MAAERASRAFWPLWSIAAAVLALLMLGVQDMVPVEAVWAAAALASAGALWALWRGLRQFRWPGEVEALARLDATMAGRPIATILDAQAVGATDAASAAVWRAHQARMAERAAAARAPAPDLRVARRDPFALRYVALLALAVALLFGSVLRIGSVAEMAPGQAQALAGGPAWEGWVEPPAYTRLPAVYLNDIAPGDLSVAEGSQITLRLYGEVGDLTVRETVSGQPAPEEPAAEPSQVFEVARDGRLSVEGPGGRAWDVALRPDRAPEVALAGEAEASARGEMTLPFEAEDDYGVVAGTARIALDLDAVDRRYGLKSEPEARPAIEVPLPLPISGDRAEFEETLIEDFSKHPWSNLPVEVRLTVEDAAGQTGVSEPRTMSLPGRRFFDPLAAAVAEQRRDLLWTRDNAGRVAQVLRAISYMPEDVFRSETTYLRLRVILRRLETFTRHGLTEDQRDDVADALWDLALLLEEGDLGDALERLRRAQDRLSEAMRNGASDEEIAELMQELREATDEYIRELARRQMQEGEEGQQNQQAQQMPGMQMTQNDLQRMMDRIQELMEQGRMAEAQEALRQLQQMMENMRVTQGQGQPSPGQQAMEGLAETLREQQGLSDEAFRELQEQFNPGNQQGQQQGQGQQGQQRPGQQFGQGQQGQPGQQGQQGQPGQGQGQQQAQPGEGQGLGESLEERQRALRNELGRQRQGLPGLGGEAGEAAREALDRAEGAMEGAERALGEGDLAEAIDRQAEAMDALREGMRNMGEALAQQQGQQQGQGQQGMAEGDPSGEPRDPLGRSAGSGGQLGTEESLLQGEDVYRRAQDLLEELRRRSGEAGRPDVELDYLERLLERF
ncbi:TIGR02302 family protein [Rhodosalinus halophilus]|uniref:TIGR02302 family protein n=2 Tax=Rhodosalinus halophilus TaxID=2259333 RepID=A0A365U6I2_9RHOB|nr:TIGR02302 family protein [Rhodosalinus halophilus]